MSGDRWIALGASLAGLAVICGAFAAHGLDTQLPKQYEGQTRVVAGETIPAARKYIADFKTAAEYQMYHALGIMVVGLLMQRRPAGSLNAAGWCFLLGIILFSGSLYALVLSGVTRFGIITPIGGLLFIIGWGAVAVGMIRRTPGAGETP